MLLRLLVLSLPLHFLSNLLGVAVGVGVESRLMISLMGETPGVEITSTDVD